MPRRWPRCCSPRRRWWRRSTSPSPARSSRRGSATLRRAWPGRPRPSEILPGVIRADVDVLAELVPLAGRDVVDIGCGDGALVRALAARGASVVGVEVSEAAVTRAQDGEHRFLVGSADALPLADGSVDACVLMRSLHHVPRAAMPRVFTECARVLRPGGAAYVAEPLAHGAYFELVARVDDEREVRALAQAAIAQATALRRERTVEYAVPLRLAG